MLDTKNKMPVLFVGHGSPMNAVEENDYTNKWVKIAQKIPKPKAILAISAHWYTDGIRINDSASPKTIYDMYGFPEELYKIEYNAKGAPDFANHTIELIQQEVKVDNSWGYDHGTWSILHKMYPKADIPVYQLSIDKNSDAKTHYRIGKEIKELREQGVLIFTSGNVVHNLQLLDWKLAGGHDWAEEFDHYIKEKILKKDYMDVINYKNSGYSSQLAVPTPEHFYPLLYALGAAEDKDQMTVFNEGCMLGGLSMTSYLFQ